MNKSVVIPVVILLVVLGGGIFYFLNQQAQNAVKDLNATLPEGIRVTKSLFGDEYTVVNEIDGYSFRVPSEWSGLNEVFYTPKEDVEGYIFSTLEVNGMGRSSTLNIINKIDASQVTSLEDWVQSLLGSFGDMREVRNNTIGEIEVVQIDAGESISDMPIYFFHKESSVYAVSNANEVLIEEMILGGNW